MSRCEIYSVDKDGDVVRYAEERNATAGALLIWLELAEKYGLKASLSNFDPVWKLADGNKLSREDKVVLLSTFDRVWIKRENLKEVADAWDKFWVWVDSLPREYKVDNTIFRVAQVLRRASDDENVYGICFNHTSVCCNPWRINLPNEEDTRSFNFKTDKEIASGGEPWELFECFGDNPNET